MTDRIPTKAGGTIVGAMTNPVGDGVLAVLPVKRFAAAKSRLGPTHGIRFRAELAEAMFHDVLRVCTGHGGLAGTLVVTREPRAARACARHGATHLRERDEAGLNEAVELGIRHALLAGARGVLVLPTDLPALRSDDLDAMLAGCRVPGVSLGPADCDGGTNWLLACPPDAIRPRFGPDSLSLHVHEAVKAGVATRIVRLEGVARDIDTDDDLAWFLASSARSTETWRFLANGPLADDTTTSDCEYHE
ncbi:2-phospho-L-lactate guanylyltransferase [Methylobacterium sp. NEAU 140]|uniref:2-phospho-L-lactate guanylyltransferase n=1 Tax=Methylobacterium sp. NEAU 140 TaxID=3064945 RepID=UPI00273720B5|nr:2-phospho-L-lactate guanylyltransferase [Methylobacterium sp. NEAU 140]MDP4026597.1 2-phospho-L-lactate guanylyltransferase [Methylobacterium sp. NEAU 140]